MDCEICDRYWSFTYNKTGLTQQIRCFCDKNVNEFPCDKCNPSECCLTNCGQFVYKKSDILCRKHYQCGKCKIPYLYEYDVPDEDNGVDGWIEFSCPSCKRNDPVKFSWDLVAKLFGSDS